MSSRTIAIIVLLSVSSAMFLLAGAPAKAQNDSATPAAAANDLQFWEELAFWEAVKNSASAAELEAYISAYPEGRFVNLARVRILKLRAAEPVQPAAAPITPPPAAPNSPTLATQRFTATTNSNIRAAPTTDASRIGAVSAGAEITVIGQVAGGDWHRVQLDDGRIGYVFASLLEAVETQTASSSLNSTTPTGTGLSAGDVFRDCDGCPAMTVIPAGRAEIGSGARRDEQPARQVTFAAPFAIGIFEITIDEWQRCFTESACQLDPEANDDTARNPVSNVSWDDAQEYVAWLRGKTGQPYRLSSESEWEYAARAGSLTAYWWGDEPGNNKANCSNCGSRWDNREVAPAGSFAANPFGLYDVHGNVWEWTQDCYAGSYQDASVDGSSRGPDGCLTRVLRGGSWKSDSSYMRSARRNKYDRDVRYFLNGLRIARDL